MKKKDDLRKYKSRLLLEGIINSMLYSSTVAFLISAIIALISWVIKDDILDFGFVVFMSSLVLAFFLFYFIKFRPSKKLLAKRLDRLGLQERVITMVEFERENASIIKKQREDTNNYLSFIEPKNIKLKISIFSIVVFIIIAVISILINILAFISANQPCVHDWGEWTLLESATCIDKGIEIRICKIDQSHTEKHYIEVDTNNHDWNEWIITIPAGETTVGEETRICKNESNHTEKRMLFAIGTTGLSYRLMDNGSYAVSIGSVKTATVVIPVIHKGLAVTAIDDAAFENHLALESIFIPDSITHIGNRAFYNCINLKNIILPSSISTILTGAFQGCEKLESINIPNGVRSINYSTFAYCVKLKSMLLPDSVLTINDRAFQNCSSLEYIFINNKLSSIGSYAFYNCERLRGVNIPESVNYIGQFAFNNTAIVNNALDKTIIYQDQWIIGSNGVLADISINSGTRGIAGGAFSNCNTLEKILLPNTIKYICDYAFASCDNLTDVILAQGIQRIGRGAFSECKSLKQIIIPEGIEELNAYVFFGCLNLKQIKLPRSMTRIYDYAFGDCMELMKVYYCGSSEEWNKIRISNFHDSNMSLIVAQRYYLNSFIQ